MWHIHGKTYDLTSFVDKHPGGKEILHQTKGMKDITALFETYHAFSNYDSIIKQLARYEVSSDETKNENQKKYDFSTYHELVERIKQTTKYKTRRSVKATWFWYMKTMFMFSCYVASFIMCCSPSVSLPLRCVSGFFAGVLWVMIGFNVMHDGSHYGIVTSSSWNNFLSRLWNAWGWWNNMTWFFHHVYAHHSFTGDEKRDPDIIHFRPFVRKTKYDTKVLRFFLKIQDKIITWITCVFPGMYTGQAISYIVARMKGAIWRVPLSTQSHYGVMEYCFMGTSLFCMYLFGLLPFLFYVFALNLTYHINIALDHDTFESTIENHYEGNDWLRMQIAHSANFVPQSMFWTHCFGGINYQIEHHVFPNMSHVHYPTIAPIVKAFCKEKAIPYVAHDTLWGGYRSFLKMMKHTSS